MIPPPPPAIHTPATEKHAEGSSMFMPLAEEIPPPKVDVAVDVAVNLEATTSPTTESLAYGDDVPMPTLPSFVTSSILTPVFCKESIPPVPCWLTVKMVLAEVEAMVEVLFVCTKSDESRPSSLSASNAKGADESSFLGVISGSLFIVIPTYSG